MWFLQLEADYSNLTWTDFEYHCNFCFGPPIHIHKLGVLFKLRQMGTVAAYQEQFEQLASRAGQLTQDQKIELYISGLQEYTFVDVELHNPTDLATAMSLSRLYECKGSSLHPSETRKFKPPDILPQSSSSKFIKQLSHSKLEDQQLKGLCFNCDEPFIQGPSL